jgi:Fe-S-cluster-containing hydrogenase component 2
MLDRTGVPTADQIRSCFPERDRLIKAKAIIECYEEIPCDPCQTSCPFDAIHIGDNINNRPTIDFDQCTGCGICVTSCPGLAITLRQIEGDQAYIGIPYEMLPKPKKGQVWHGIDRNGDVLCDARIERVKEAKRQDHTDLVTVSIPVEFLEAFMTIRVKT